MNKIKIIYQQRKELILIKLIQKVKEKKKVEVKERFLKIYIKEAKKIIN